MKNKDLVKTSNLTFSNTHRAPPGLNDFLKSPLQNAARNAHEKRRTEKRNINACRLDFRRQECQNVSPEAPNLGPKASHFLYVSRVFSMTES